MSELTRLIVVPTLALGLALGVSGCGDESSDVSSQSADVGRDHSEEAHDGHDHGPGEHDDHDHEHDGHDHGEPRSLGTLKVGSATFDVSISGALQPGAEIHVDLVHTGGPAPAAIRLWIGDDGGAGALKAKADKHDDHFHGHTEVPPDLDGAALWIEVEATEGSRTRSSLPLDK